MLRQPHETPPHPLHAAGLRCVHDELRAVSAVNPETARKRIQRGWCPDRARTVPARKRDEVALAKRVERRTLRDLASAHVTSIYAARLSLWANWRGPVSPDPLVWSVGVQIAPAGQGGPFAGAPSA